MHLGLAPRSCRVYKNVLFWVTSIVKLNGPVTQCY